MTAIPKDIALQLCSEIREENRSKWCSFARVQCWGCSMFAKGDSAKLCINSKPDYSGCNLVNARYARMKKT